jgi:hypothetical protein
VFFSGLLGSYSGAVASAENPALLWAPSQNGLFAEAPHRHNTMVGPAVV